MIETACPTVCTPQIFLNPNLVTLILIFFVVIVLFKKPFNLWVRYLSLLIILLLVGIFTTQYNPCGSGCSRQKTIFILSLFPEKSFVNMFLNIPPVKKPPTSENLPPAGTYISFTELMKNPETYVDKKVAVNAYVTEEVICTMMACSKQNPCCNACTGRFKLGTPDSARTISLVSASGKSLGCAGNECNRECNLLEPDDFYIITGNLRKTVYGNEPTMNVNYSFEYISHKIGIAY